MNKKLNFPFSLTTELILFYNIIMVSKKEPETAIFCPPTELSLDCIDFCSGG